MTGFVRWVDALSRLCGVLAALLLLFAMLVVTEMVLARYVFTVSTTWQTDAVVFSATAAIFMGAPYVLLDKGHVGVDFVQLVVQPATRRRMDQAGAWLGLAFCAIMAIAVSLYLYEAIVGGWTTSSIARIPLWMPLAPVVIGFVLLCLQYVAELIKLYRSPT